LVVDEGKIAEYEAQISDLKSKVDTLRAKVAKRKANKAKRPKKSGGGGAGGGPSRKGSTVKASPGVSNGHAKKARKPKDISYRDDDGDDDDEVVNLTTSQKTDLAEKIQNADGSVLQKAITIIQKAQDVGSVSQIYFHSISLGYSQLTLDRTERSSSISIHCLPPLSRNCTSSLSVRLKRHANPTTSQRVRSQDVNPVDLGRA
jgi:hypothetical protein